MTLLEMYASAARYSDRYDEFEYDEDGDLIETDDSIHYCNVFRDAINEAYREVSRIWASPDTYSFVTVDENCQIDLTLVTPQVYMLKDLLNEDKTASVPYTFFTKNVLNVDLAPGTILSLFYHYIPDVLSDYNDIPVFTDAQVDPMVYISLAVARMWYSEKKFDYGNQWMAQYQAYLRQIHSDMRSRGARRIPRRLFR